MTDVQLDDGVARPTAAITFAAASRAVAAVCDAARHSGQAMSAAVVDPGGHLVAFARMDYAPLLTIDLAIDKAHTAIRFGVPSGAWYDLIKGDPAMLAALPGLPRLVILGGGLPIREGGHLVGGLGVSGGSPDEDAELARLALVALRLE
jgi:uncharacterized protein GlcG (DUF336 family)